MTRTLKLTRSLSRVCMVTATLLGILLLPAMAYADNCDVRIDPGDCQRTGWTSGVLAGIFGAIAATAAAASAATGMQSRTETVTIIDPGDGAEIPLDSDLVNITSTLDPARPCDRSPARKLLVRGLATDAAVVTVNGQTVPVLEGQWQAHVPLTGFGPLALTATSPRGGYDQATVSITDGNPASTQWCVRVVSSFAFNGILGLPGSLAQLALLPGLVKKGLIIEVRSPETGEKGTLTFGGIGPGSGFGRATSSNSWTHFVTEVPYRAGDFQGLTAIGTMSAGAAVQFGPASLLFGNIRVRYDDWWSNFWYGDSVEVGGVISPEQLKNLVTRGEGTFGTGLDVSVILGMAHLTDRGFDLG